MFYDMHTYYYRLETSLNYRQARVLNVNIPKEINRFCPKCKKPTIQKISIYKAGKRRGTAAGERRHALRKKGYGGQKFPKLAKPAKTTKKVTQIFTCPECKKKPMKDGIRIRKFEWNAK